jgi:hypothetical protein|tara:strand:+ start:2386 stop:2556 length:171 start_codon:yes stop_codon:yes gene_type:complete
MKATLSKDDYREFNERVDTLSNKGVEVPHVVTKISDNQFEIELLGSPDLDELDRLS